MSLALLHLEQSASSAIFQIVQKDLHILRDVPDNFHRHSEVRNDILVMFVVANCRRFRRRDTLGTDDAGGCMGTGQKSSPDKNEDEKLDSTCERSFLISMAVSVRSHLKRPSERRRRALSHHRLDDERHGSSTKVGGDVCADASSERD